MSTEDNKAAKLITRLIVDSLPYILLFSSKLGFTLLPIFCATIIIAGSSYALLGGLACISLHGIEEIELRCRERKYDWLSYFGRIATFYTLFSSGWFFAANYYAFVVTFGFTIRVIGFVKVRKVEQGITSG